MQSRDYDLILYVKGTFITFRGQFYGTVKKPTPLFSVGFCISGYSLSAFYFIIDYILVSLKQQLAVLITQLLNWLAWAVCLFAT